MSTPTNATRLRIRPGDGPRSATTRAFRCMLLAADRMDMPERHRVDLSTDLRILLGEFDHMETPERFVWALRPGGTRMFPVTPADTEDQLRRFDAWLDVFGHHGPSLWFWTAEELVNVSVFEAERIIREGHGRHILAD